MPSSYSARLKFEKQATGENSGTWGDRANENTFDLLEFGMHGLATVTPSGNTTLTSTNGTETNGNAAFLKLASGSVSANYTLEFTGVEMFRAIKNDSGYTATLQESGAATTVDIEDGEIFFVYSDGTNVYKVADVTQAELDAMMPLAGGTFTGDVTVATGSNLVLVDDPGDATHAAPKSWIEAQITNAALSAEIPSQSGNSGKFLGTDGTNASWLDVLPTQSGNSGKYLGTNGSSASWTAFPTTLAGYGITDAALPYTTLSGDITGVINNHYGADSTTAARTVTLPAHVENGVVRLSDEDGNASTNNAILSDGTDTWTVDVDYGWIELVSKSSAWILKARG